MRAVPSVVAFVLLLFGLILPPVPGGGGRTRTAARLRRHDLRVSLGKDHRSRLGCEDFQTALVAARPGDVITLAAGATYRGPFNCRTSPAPGGSRCGPAPRTAACHLLGPRDTRARPSH